MPEGTKYPVLYPSSKDGDIPIEEMNDFHLVNAYRRRCGQLGEDAAAFAMGLKAVVTGDLLLPHLAAELRERGLDPHFKGGRPPESPAVQDGGPA